MHAIFELAPTSKMASKQIIHHTAFIWQLSPIYGTFIPMVVENFRVNNDFEYMVLPITEDDIGSHALAGQSKGSIVLAP